MNDDKMTQSEFLTLIIQRPGLYVGYGSVERTKAFLDGYTAGRGGDVDPVYLAFNTWVAKRFDLKILHGWSSIVTFIGGSEASSFKLLAELWTEYKEEAESK